MQPPWGTVATTCPAPTCGPRGQRLCSVLTPRVSSRPWDLSLMKQDIINNIFLRVTREIWGSKPFFSMENADSAPDKKAVWMVRLSSGDVSAQVTFLCTSEELIASSHPGSSSCLSWLTQCSRLVRYIAGDRSPSVKLFALILFTFIVFLLLLFLVFFCLFVCFRGEQGGEWEFA